MRSRATRSRTQALKWCRGVGHGLDGIMAKPLGEAYRPGQRAMQKYKLWKTVDCVVGGYYRGMAAARSSTCCWDAMMTTVSSTMSGAPGQPMGS